MNREVKYFLVLFMVAMGLSLLGLVLVSPAAASEVDGHEFTWERGPIRRELVRIVDPRIEDKEALERHLHRTAWAISDASLIPRTSGSFTTEQRRALLLALGKHESHFDQRVCTDFSENAPGFPAVGCWQDEETPPPESLEAAAIRAVEKLESASRYCVARGFDPIVGAFSLYATGRTCDWAGAKKRAATYSVIYWRLSA